MSRESLRPEEAEFYENCAAILGVEHQFSHRFERRTRWNHRQLGNGRFPGFGVIRMYASDRIHLCLHTPRPVSGTFRSAEDVLIFLRGLVAGLRRDHLEK